MLRFNLLTGDTSMHEPLGEASSFTQKPRGFERAARRGDSRTHERARTNRAQNNPFDLHNAAMLPALLASVPDPETKKPLVRVIPNKFPVLKIPLARAAEACDGGGSGGGVGGLRKSMPAAGRQEVVIQHWRYDRCQALSTREECKLLWRVLQQRVAANIGLEHVAYVQLIENHGVRSGASLPHPHAQLLALPFVPGDQHHRLDLARKHFEDRCEAQANPFDVAIKEAREDGRMLFENNGCAAFVPYGLDKCCEIWVVSKCAEADTLAKEPCIDLCAEGVRQSLKMLYQEKDDPPYNLLVRQNRTQWAAAATATAGVDGGRCPWYRWHAVILPHNVHSRWAGVKGYGNFVPMTGTPEDHARQLRQWRDRPFEHVPAPPPAVVDEFAQQRGRALASGACALLLAVGVGLLSRSRR